MRGGVRIRRAERVELARKRQASVYSLKAKFSHGHHQTFSRTQTLAAHCTSLKMRFRIMQHIFDIINTSLKQSIDSAFNLKPAHFHLAFGVFICYNL